LARDEREALDLASKNRLCLVVLGFAETPVRDPEVCRRVRSLSGVPILTLSAHGDAADVVRGLAAGADDYVVKPFRLLELIARVKALVRRGGMRPLMHTVSHGDITLDLDRRSVLRQGERVSLTSSELKILEVLMAAPGRVFSRKELLLYLYPSGGVVIERVIDVHVQKLRAKLEHDRARLRHILTARGFGYRFADPLTANPPSAATTTSLRLSRLPACRCRSDRNPE
jgi:DNA-binding response OmpR family regulator